MCFGWLSVGNFIHQMMCVDDGLRLQLDRRLIFMHALSHSGRDRGLFDAAEAGALGFGVGLGGTL